MPRSGCSALLGVNLNFLKKCTLKKITCITVNKRDNKQMISNFRLVSQHVYFIKHKLKNKSNKTKPLDLYYISDKNQSDSRLY